MDDRDELIKLQQEYIKFITDELCFALKTFETGVYEKTDRYNDLSWVKIRP